LRGDVTSKRIVEILEILNDGQGHLSAEIERKMKLTRGQVKQVVDFLREYDFVTVDEANRKIRINEEARSFLSQKPIQ
jgi:DNA-binding IclR family transcriptional regulator